MTKHVLRSEHRVHELHKQAPSPVAMHCSWRDCCPAVARHYIKHDCNLQQAWPLNSKQQWEVSTQRLGHTNSQILVSLKIQKLNFIIITKLTICRRVRL
jgi:hypothetical protein